jgi:hypothetical protein
MTVPIIEQPDGSFIAQFLGNLQVMKSDEERNELEKTIRLSGFYS